MTTQVRADELVKLLRPEFGNASAGSSGGASLTEGPGIDIASHAIGLGGDTILIYHANGNPVSEEPATGAGLIAALAALEIGDLVELPPACNIAGGPWTVPAGGGLCGHDLTSILTGTVINNGKLSNLRIDGNVTNNAQMNGVWVVPSVGTGITQSVSALIEWCWVQMGVAATYGIDISNGYLFHSVVGTDGGLVSTGIYIHGAQVEVNNCRFGGYIGGKVEQACVVGNSEFYGSAPTPNAGSHGAVHATAGAARISNCSFGCASTGSYGLMVSNTGLTLTDCAWNSISGLANITYGTGDRAAYSVENYHSGDIELNTLTRHLPLPVAIGDMAVVNAASNWAILTDVAAGQPLLSGGVATMPTYAGYYLVGTAAQTYTFPATGRVVEWLGAAATGAVVADPTGGNARGDYTVDLQVYRSVATQVASGINSVISGGRDNTATAPYGVIGGGYSNTSQGIGATVCGGMGNVAGGLEGTVLGGIYNQALGDYSVACGRRAIIAAAHDGSFLFADWTDADFNSATAGEFAIRARGGFRHAYDDSVCWTAQISAAGEVTFDAVGSNALFDFDQAVSAAGGIAALGGIVSSQVDGAAGGFKAGSAIDVQWYRSAANTWCTPDNIAVGGATELISTTAPQLKVGYDADSFMTVDVANATGVATFNATKDGALAGSFVFTPHVGIGTTTGPATFLHLNGANIFYRGQLTIQSSDYAQLTLYGGATTQIHIGTQLYFNVATHTTVLQCYDGTSTTVAPLLLNPGGGNVGIGMPTAPTAKLHVVGLVDYANNAAAVAAGLTTGAFYTETGTNPKRVCVVT